MSYFQSRAGGSTFYDLDGRNCLDPAALKEMGFQYKGIGKK
ncbi:hypothetical protein [Desulforamulus ruminis]|nr:hypothetical protein [Desulforamulus ruminis]